MRGLSPKFSMLNTRNQRLVNFESICDLSLGASRLSNFFGLLARNFRTYFEIVMTFAARQVIRPIFSCMATPAGAISHVFQTCTQIQMIRPDAFRIIAVVKNLELTGYLTALNDPTNSVSQQFGWEKGSGPEIAITPFVQGSRPLPTKVGFTNLRPKKRNSLVFCEAFHGFIVSKNAWRLQ